MGKTLVIVEHRDGEVKGPTYSAITFARAVCEKAGGTFDIAVIGSGVAGAGAKLTGYGAEKIHVADSAVFGGTAAQAWAYATAEIAKAIGATVVVAAATAGAKAFLPRAAVRLGAGVASDVVALGTKGALSFVRPMWAGNVYGEVEITTPVKVLTIRPTEFAPAATVGSNTPVVPFATTFAAADCKARLVEFKATVSARPDLAEAKVVVAGGRGLKGKENFKMLEELADLFGGAVGATRAAVDAEFIANDFQIGQTGKVVAPELYFAVGISGAIQHIAGMKASKVIVAINKDEEAPIFQVADYGLVGDLFKAVPEILEAVKAKRG
jgi:electron transfer flavoprotein alpha subunit